ncbi:hypothetical protein Tco_1150814, partial [Tanacetum coccineum]
ESVEDVPPTVEPVATEVQSPLIDQTNTMNTSNKKKGVDSTNKNVENSSTNTTPIMDKIRKFENFIIEGQAILVDETGNPQNVEYPSDHDNEDEVASVDNDMARSLASERTVFGTQSLPLQEKWLLGRDEELEQTAAAVGYGVVK